VLSIKLYCALLFSVEAHYHFVCRSSEPVCNGSELKTQKSNVRELAMAMLQIEQMVESKYLNPPLGTQHCNYFRATVSIKCK